MYFIYGYNTIWLIMCMATVWLILLTIGVFLVRSFVKGPKSKSISRERLDEIQKDDEEFE